MIRRCTSAALLFMLVLAASGCGASSSEASGLPGGQRKLVLSGSSTVAPLAAEIARRFEALHPGVRVDVQSGGSARGLADARSGLADIGMISRGLRQDESDLDGAVIARDGICIIVHADNPLTALSEEQVAGIYTGRLTDWIQVGGSQGPITVVNKAEGRSTLELFLAYFRLRSPDVRASVVIGDNEQGIKTVAGNPGAIGYISSGAADVSVRAGVPIRLLPLAGVAATTENVQSGAFPLARPLVLVTRGAPTELAAEFIEFARSRQVGDLVRELGLVPLE